MKGYSMKKRVIAFVLAIAVVLGSNGFYNLMEVVRAEGNTNPNLVTVTKVELLNNGSTEVAPGVLRFNITGSAKEDVTVSEIALIFTGADGQEITLVYAYEDSTSHWRPGTTGSTKSFSVSLPDNTGNQTYELTTVRLVSTGVNNLYTYYNREKEAGEYTDVFYGNLMESEYEPIPFVYDRGADFTVRGSQAGDTVAPLIQSIERIAPAAGETITPRTTVTYRVNYVEEGSGLRKIQVAFNNGSTWDTINKDFESPYKGELTLTSWSRGLGDYEINYIEIVDYSDNKVCYSWQDVNGTKTFGYEEHTKQGYEFIPVGEDFFINGAEAYSVALKPYHGLKLTSVKLEADEDTNLEGKQLHAGETYTANVTVKNDGAQSVNVDPMKLRVGWMSFANNNSWDFDVYGVGEEQILSPGESATIQVPFTVNQFWSALKFNLQRVYINFLEEEYRYDIAYEANNVQNREYLCGYNSDWEWVDTVDNSACLADFTVVPGENVDTEAPVLASLSSNSESFTAPGRATFQLVMSEEGKAKFEKILFMNLVDVDDSRNELYVDMESNPTYKAMDNGTYQYSFDLPNDVIKGTYVVREVVCYDEAGNYRDYMLDGDKLVDLSDDQNQIAACRINVDSEITDKDFDYPIIKDIQLNVSNNSITAGEQIQFEIEVEDESGLGGAWLEYTTGASSDFFYVDTNSGSTSIEEIPAVNNGCKRFRIKAWTEKYCLEESYKLTGISIYDNSVRYNGCYYRYDGINGQYVLVETANDEQPITFTPNKELGLTVRLPQGMYLAKADDMQSAIQSLPSDATTLVVTKDDQDVSLSGDDLKDKNVDIIVPDASETSEIQISSELFKGTNGLDNLILNVQRDGLIEEEVAADSEDDMYYPVQVVSSESDIAMTLCIRLDEEFLSQCGDNKIALYDNYGNKIADDLTVNARGEVTVKLEQLKQDTPATKNSRGVTLETHEFRIASTKENTDESTLRFSGASLTLYNDISVNYKVSKALLEENGYTNPYVKFVLNGKETIVRIYREEGDKLVFDFDNLAPNQMNDTIYATLYATKEGELCASEVTEYSVAEYCYNMLEKYSSNDGYKEFCTLLVDLLNYGATSQEYTGYNVDALVNASLTEEQKAMGTSEMRELSSVFNKEHKAISNPTVAWKGASLKLEDSVTLRFTIETEDISNMVATIHCGDQQWSIAHSEFVELDNNKYYVYFEGLNAAQMSDTVYATITRDDTAVSNTVAYSIESYAYSKLNNTGTTETLQNILKAMMKYGDAAKAYLGRISN